jgi:hypothetical protein
MVGAGRHDGERAVRQIPLIAQVFVRRKQDFVAGSLGPGDEAAFLPTYADEQAE